MNKKPKLLERRQKREQPQQKVSKPPPLQQSEFDDTDLEKWKVINMQYRALFKKNSGDSEDNRAVSPISIESSPKDPLKTPETFNKFNQHYVAKKLRRAQQSYGTVSSQDTEDFPKYLSLLEQAKQSLQDSSIENSATYETNLREQVQKLHNQKLEKTLSTWKDKIHQENLEIEELASKNAQLENKMRKNSIQSRTETEEITEMQKLKQEISEIESQLDEIYSEKDTLSQTIALLEKDIQESQFKFSHKENQLLKDLELIQQELTTADNNQTELLQKESESITKQNKLLEEEIEKIQSVWKGGYGDMSVLVKDAETTTETLQQELKDIHKACNILETELIHISKERERVNKHKHDLAKTTPKKDPFAFHYFLDALLTQTAKNILDQDKTNPFEPNNLVKDYLEKNFKGPSQIPSKAKALRDALCNLARRNQTTFSSPNATQRLNYSFDSSIINTRRREHELYLERRKLGF